MRAGAPGILNPDSAEESSRGHCLDANVRAQFVVSVLLQLRKDLMLDRTCAKVVQDQTTLHAYLMIEWLQGYKCSQVDRCRPAAFVTPISTVILYNAQAVYPYVFQHKLISYVDCVLKCLR